ncbi:hypothetical protein HDU76_005614, partial [Blyttiomyces sp. JEL0837]
MRLDPTVTIFYMDSEYQVDVLDNELLQEALMETQSFKINGTFINKSAGMESLVSSTGGSATSVTDQSPVAAPVVTGGIQEVNSQGMSKSKAQCSITVDHMESKKRAKLRVDPDVTLKEFKNNICTKMEFGTATAVSVFYMDSEFRVYVTDDESLQDALEDTHSFRVELVLQESNVNAIRDNTTENIPSVTNDGYVVKVIFENTEY